MRGPAPFLLFALLLAAGCGGDGKKLYPVTGKVTYQSKPAAGAMVIFHPKGDNTPQAIRPSAVVNEDGTFSLSSGVNAEGKGAAAGEYDVTVTWNAPTKTKGKEITLDPERREETDQFGGRYKTPAASGLKATVNAGPTEVPPFDLK